MKIVELLGHIGDAIESSAISKLMAGFFVLDPIGFLAGSIAVMDKRCVSIECWRSLTAAASHGSRLLAIRALHHHEVRRDKIGEQYWDRNCGGSGKIEKGGRAKGESVTKRKC